MPPTAAPISKSLCLVLSLWVQFTPTLFQSPTNWHLSGCLELRPYASTPPTLSSTAKAIATRWGIPSTPYLAPLPNVSPKLNNIITYLTLLPYASNSFSEYTEFNLSYESHRGGRHVPGLCAHLRCKEARLGRIPNGQLHAELAPRLRHRLLRTRRPIPQHRQQWVSRAHSSRIFNWPTKTIIAIFAGPAKIAFSLNSPVQLSSMPWVSTMWKSCALARIYASRNHTCVRNTGSCTRSVNF